MKIRTSSKKKPTVSKLKNKAWDLFSRYIRLRDCLFTTRTKERGRCITCGFEFPFNDLQAGHFVSGRGNSVLFDEECVHAQCRTCNILKGGKTLVYRRKILELYGDGYDEVLEKRAQVVKKFTISELEDLITELEEKIKEIGK